MQKENILNYLAEIKSDLRQKGIEKIGLFGSFAKDEASPFSDIDIAIQLQKEYLKKNDVWEYFNLIENIKEKLLKKFSRKVDVYDLDSTGNIRNTISRDVIYV
jgi:predicted nucleotidyltransferase